MQIVYTLALQGQSVYWGHGLLGIILGKVGSLLDLASRLLLSPEPRVPFSLNVSTESRPIQHTQKLQGKSDPESQYYPTLVYSCRQCPTVNRHLHHYYYCAATTTTATTTTTTTAATTSPAPALCPYPCPYPYSYSYSYSYSYCYCYCFSSSSYCYNDDDDDYYYYYYYSCYYYYYYYYYY